MIANPALYQSFLAGEVFSLYMLIIAIIFWSQADYYRSLIANVKEPGLGVMLFAALSLFIGLFLVLTHNDWVFEPRVSVTILSWLFLMQSVAWLAAPIQMLKLIKRICSGKGYYLMLIVLATFGLILISKGFYLFIHLSGALPLHP